MLFVYAARVLGADDYGRYSHAASSAALAVVGMDLGLNLLFVRDGARDPKRLPSYAGTLLVLKAALALLVLGGMYAFCGISGFGAAQAAAVMLATLAHVLWGFCELGIAGLNAVERMDQEARAVALGRLAALLLAGSGLVLGLGIWGLLGGLILANALAALIALGMLYKKGGFRPRLERGFLAYLAREALPLAVAHMFILVYFRLDIVMLKMLGQSYAAIGWYAAGVRIITAIAMVPAMVAAAFLPVLSSLFMSDKAAMAELYEKGRRLLLVLGLPAAAGLYAVRGQIAIFIYGDQFGPTAAAFVWLAPAVLILFLNFLQISLLTALGRQRLVALATGVCVIINLGLNLLLVPRFGFAGAAQATLATELCLFGLCAWYIRGGMGAASLWRQALKPAMAALIMALALHHTPALMLPMRMALGGVIYFGVLVLMRGFSRAELMELLAVFRPKAAK